MATPAFAAEFQVNKDTKFQVNVEVGAYHEDVKTSKGVSNTAFTGKGLNQIEIKADHVVSADVTVFGEIEIDYDPIGDNGTILTDDVRVGINSKAMGRFSVGQFDSFFEDNVIEVLSTANGEYGSLSEAASDNDGRRLQWVKPLGPVTLAVEASRATSTTDKTKTGTGFGVTGMYKLGALTLAVGMANLNKFSSAGAAVTNEKTTAASAKYDMGNLSFMGLVAKQDKLNGDAIDIMGAGLKYKMGQFDVGVAFQNLEETGKDKRTEMSLGLGYKPFKNMTFYFDVLKTDKAKKEGDALEVGVKYAF